VDPVNATGRLRIVRHALRRKDTLPLLGSDKSRPLGVRGDDYRRYFKTGAAVDLQLGTRAETDPDRKTPEAGDLRILITRVKSKPVAVLSFHLESVTGLRTYFDTKQTLTFVSKSVAVHGGQSGLVYER